MSACVLSVVCVCYRLTMLQIIVSCLLTCRKHTSRVMQVMQISEITFLRQNLKLYTNMLSTLLQLWSFQLKTEAEPHHPPMHTQINAVLYAKNTSIVKYAIQFKKWV